MGLPRWLRGRECACQCRRCGFYPWVRKTPWRRKWQPTPVFLPGKSHGQRSLAGNSPWGSHRVRHGLVTQQSLAAAANILQMLLLQVLKGIQDKNIFILHWILPKINSQEKSWNHGIFNGPCCVLSILLISFSANGPPPPPSPDPHLWWCFSLTCCYSLVTKSCPTPCDPMDCSTLGFPVLHYLLDFAQTHVHWIDDVIQPSHPLLSPSPPALNLSQHQGPFPWVGSSHQVAKVLELQHQSFQWIFRVDFLLDWLLWFPCCPRDSPESSYFLDPVNSRVLWRVSSVSWVNLPLFIYSLITLALLHPWG